MRLRNDSGSWTAWESFRTTMSWTLRDEQGPRTVYLEVRDDDYNVTEAQDSIVLNTGPEINDFKINNGDTYCSSPEVTLNITATGATEMCFRNDNGSWTSWEPFRNRTMWTLNPTQGTRTAEVKVRDAQGNESFMQDSIILVLPDLTVSDITLSNSSPAAGETVWITITVHNNGGAGYPDGGDAKNVVVNVYDGHPSNYIVIEEFGKSLVPAGDSCTFTMLYGKPVAGCFDVYVVVDPYDKIVDWFNDDRGIALLLDYSNAEYQKILNSVDGLSALIKKIHPNAEKDEKLLWDDGSVLGSFNELFGACG